MFRKRSAVAAGRDRKRLAAAFAVGGAIAVATSTVAYGEPLVGTGDSAEGTYASVALTGESRSSQGLAVSGTGDAWGGQAGITGTGDAYGPVSVDPNRTMGTVYGTTWQGVETILHNTGINPGETPYQLWTIVTSPPPNPQEVLDKEKKRLENLQAMVEDTAANPPPVIEPTNPGRGPTTSESAPISGFSQPNGWSCVPTSARTLWAHRGMPDYTTLNRQMGTDEARGTTLATAAAVVRRNYVGPSKPKLDRVDTRIELMSRAVTAITNYDQGIMVGAAISHLKWWDNGDGTPRTGWHVLSAYAYVPMRGNVPGRALVYVWDSRRTGPGSGGWGSSSQKILSDDLAMAASDSTEPGKPNMIW